MNNLKKASQTRMVVAIALFAAAVISAMALTALGNQSDTYWVARHAIVPGAQISEDDLAQVEVALGEISSGYISKEFSVAGSFALRAIAKNELISLGAVSDLPRGVATGQVPISIRNSDLPSDIEIGEKIDIYWVPDVMGIDKTGPAELVISGAFLNSINRKASNFGSEISLTISVANNEIFQLLGATSNGRLVIVRSNG
jgi:hypothetical protein